MKRILFAVSILVLSATIAFGQVFDFTVFNSTGYTIYAIYVSAADDDQWGEDVLGKYDKPPRRLEVGQHFEIVFPNAYEKQLLALGVDKYDLKVELVEGFVEYYDLYLETIQDVTLKIDKKGDGVASFH